MHTATSLLDSCTPGMTLPQGFYLDKAIFEAEMQSIFQTQWLFAGHSCEVAEPGQYFTLSIGRESLIVIRDREGNLQAHFNVCRHRGSRLAWSDRGCVKSLVCPYHGWVYQLDGSLKAARLMGETFNPDAYPLVSTSVRELAGLVFVCFSPQPPDFEAAVSAIAPQLGPHRLDQAKVIARDRYHINANWKTILENNRECYHCRVAHPEFMLSNYDAGLPGDDRNKRFQRTVKDAYQRWQSMGLNPQDVSFPDGSWFRVARFPLRNGFLTESLHGRLTAPLMGNLPSADVGSLRLVGMPNFWGHANADYTMTTQVIPLSPEATQINVAFLVHPDAVEGTDYAVDDVAAVWRATSEQDWQICESNYLGVCSSAYQPGHLSPLMEASVAQFITWYLRQMTSHPSAASSSKW
ncbi:aromatic ring-hydroxylating dioxygenase subunit alpha [Oscillatoria sp. CS-180]|uniref:aromatic ring-hydroxylating oxygenase subunit alpha n=1 Tax=Oscillatoria sp. CS-180 TaxID=3021720 RepID=UPI00232C9490|nr:aromatic ring-hydroxylating dioxygenase subunit alpha [Oscillatoria sp. CS-180]MDB9529668.1 aromatic ring-hydroxylating dioxygenase subunit alpha [Oscillatoria sp. CS-180]